MKHAWLSLVAALLLVSSCSVIPPGNTGEAAPPKASATPSKPASIVPQALTKAAMYDYDAALALLASENSDQAKQAIEKVTADKANAVLWEDNSKISHIFYHSLIVDPDRAFARTTGQRVGYMQYMVTQHEFEAQLEQMHKNGYVLIHPHRIAAPNSSGVMTYQAIQLPAGKKPFVLSIDDVSYYDYMKGQGFATSLVLTPEGKVTNTYIDASGATKHGAYDVSTVVDAFVEKHPDFSYRGDKGTFALTGYEGVFGYRTSVSNYGDTPATREAQEKAKAIADALKKSGWKFASHSFQHWDFGKRSVDAIKGDMTKWKRELTPILGETDQLIYAFGGDIGGIKPYTNTNAKYAWLQEQGFKYFFPIDSSTPSWIQLQPGSLRQARINIDGISMQRALDGKTKTLDLFFNTKSVLDPKRPMPTP